MRIQWKITLIVLAINVTVIAAMTWRTQSLFYSDKMEFVSDSSMKQIAPLKRLVQEKIEETKTSLVNFAAGRVALGQGKMRDFGHFDVVALVQPSDQGEQWTPTWIEKGATAKVESWPVGHELTLLKSLPFSKVKDGETLWLRLSDAQGAPVYAFLLTVEIHNPAVASGVADQSQLPDDVTYANTKIDNAKTDAFGTGKGVMVGFATQNILASVAEDYIGSTSAVFLVDDRGYVASHVNKAYLGSVFSDDQVVRDILKNKATMASGDFEDIDGQAVFAHYEKVERSNLYAVITTPVVSYLNSVRSTTISIALFGLMIGTICLLGAFLFGRRVTLSLRNAISILQSVSRGEPHLSVKPSNSGDEIGILSRMLAESSPAALQPKSLLVDSGLQDLNPTPSAFGTATGLTGASRGASESSFADFDNQSRRAALEVFNDGVVATLRDPLLAILGHSQLLRSKAEESGLKIHTESIEREARNAKDLLEKLSQWSSTGVGYADQETVDMQSAIHSMIRRNREAFEQEGIEVITDLRPIPRVKGSLLQMQSILGHIFDNAREAMRDRVERKLKIQTDFFRDQAYLIISDTGIGMSKEVKDRAFDPFFKSFGTPHHQGLGLAFVRAALRQIGAVCEIESKPEEGATFTIKLPVPAEEKYSFQSGQVPKSAVIEELKAQELPRLDDFFSDDEDDYEKEIQALEKSVSDSSPILAKNDFVASLDLNDDDDEEIFSNVPLAGAIIEPISEVTTEDGVQSGFQVKIRKPKRAN